MRIGVAFWILVFGLCMSSLSVLAFGPQLAEASVVNPSIIDPITNLTSSAVLTGYNYQKPITITNAGSGLTDYQMLFEVDTASLVSAGRMYSDCRDLRFATAAGTELPYWIESGANTSATKVWVKVPSIQAGTSTIYMCYGNSSAASAENGETTFEFFDDFLTNTWTDSRGAWKATTFDGRTVLQSGADGGTQNQITYKNVGDKGDNWAVKLYTYWDSPGGYSSRRWGVMFADAQHDDSTWSGYRGNLDELYPTTGATDQHRLTRRADNVILYEWATASGAPSKNTWARQTFKKTGTKVSLTDTTTVSKEDSTPLTVPFAYLSIIHDCYGTGASGKLNVDWILVRKYTSTEQGYSFGDEETVTGLVAHWRFDEGSGTTASDNSGNGNTGTIHGATWVDGMTINGATGKGLSFDGTDDFIYKDTGVSGIGGTDKMTLEAWIKRGTTSSDGAICTVGDYDAYQFLQLIIRGDDKIQATFGNDASTAHMQFWTDNTLTDTTNWHHIVATYDAGTIHIYVDSVDWAGTHSGTWAGNVVSPTIYLRIGNTYYSGNIHHFNGIIDEVKIYNDARSPAEILADYQAIAGTPTAPTLTPASDIAANALPTLTWTSVSGAAWYHVQIDDDAGFSSLVDDNTLTTNTYTPTITLPSGTYYWRVSSIDASGNEGSFSATDSFTVQAAPAETSVQIIAVVAVLVLGIVIGLLIRERHPKLRPAPKPAPPKKKPPKLSSAQIESMVYTYIKRHRGELDVRRCAKKLELSEREVRMAVEVLKARGKVAEE